MPTVSGVVDMYNDPGVSALGFQLELYRWEDHFRRMRDIREHDTSLAVAHAQLDWMTDQHNTLVSRYNGLVSEAKRQLEERDARIADLERHLAAAKATEHRLRTHAHNMMILRLDEAKERRQREEARSQQT